MEAAQKVTMDEKNLKLYTVHENYVMEWSIQLCTIIAVYEI